MNSRENIVESAHKRMRTLASLPGMAIVSVIAIASYTLQYALLDNSTQSYFFLGEYIRTIIPLFLFVAALHKYQSSHLPGWKILIVASGLFFTARIIEVSQQSSLTIRNWLPFDFNLAYLPVYPFAIVGILLVGLHSQGAIMKARVIFSSITLAASLAFAVTSLLVLHTDHIQTTSGYTTNVFINVFILAFSFCITLFCGVERVILPLTIALFLNALTDIFVYILPSHHEPLIHPVAFAISFLSTIAFTGIMRTDDTSPQVTISSQSEDLLHYFIHFIVFLSVIYATYLYVTYDSLPNIMHIMVGSVFIALLGEQLVTYRYNRLLIQKSEHDLNVAQSSEEKFRIAFENGPTTLVLLDERGHIVRANNAFFRFSAFSESDVIGSALSYIIHPDDRAIFDVNLATVLSELEGHSINVECRFLQKDGTTRWGSTSVSHIPLNDAEDQTAEFVVQIEDITDQKVHESELKSLAARDPLTGLWNRTHIFELITHVAEESTLNNTGTDGHNSFSVMFIDLDRFKIINDTYGHAAGDIVLHITAERITSIVGMRGEVARIGGDEFVVLLSAPVSETVSSLIAHEIKEILCQPILLSQGETIVTCSIGVVMCAGNDMTAQDILRDADAAMYRAKQQGKNSIEVSASKDRKQISTELKIANELRRALNSEQIHVYYQPIVSLSTNEIIGFEALTRWIHPKRGLIKPDDFIPLAEDTGLILDIGYYIMEEAFTQLAQWQAAHTTSSGRPLTMNVNLSVTQLRDPKLLREIERVKNQCHAAPHSAAFEITESAVLGDAKRAIALLHDIRDLGFRLRVDDFGTGYSSLAYLKKLPIDGFKIDKSFVDGLDVDEDDTAIIHALLGLAQSMHLTVTAEGIEQEAQRLSLKKLGCDYGQGYLFSQGVPADEIVFSPHTVVQEIHSKKDSA